MEPNTEPTQSQPQEQQQTTNEPQFEGWKPEEIAHYKEYQALRTGQPTEPQAEPTSEEQRERSASTVDFELQLPADLPPNDLPPDFEEQLGAYSDAASAAGLDGRTSQRLLNAMVEAGLDSPYERELTGEWARTDAMKEMERQWGGDYERRIALVKQTVDKLGDEFKTFLDATGQGNNPACLEALYQYASGDLTISKADAQKRLDKILQDPKHPYWNKNVGSHERKKIVGEVRRLNQVIGEDDAPIPARPQPQKPSAQESAKTSARAELATLAGKKSLSVDERKKFIDLVAKL